MATRVLDRRNRQAIHWLRLTPAVGRKPMAEIACGLALKADRIAFGTSQVQSEVTCKECIRKLQAAQGGTS